MTDKVECKICGSPYITVNQTEGYSKPRQIHCSPYAKVARAIGIHGDALKEKTIKCHFQVGALNEISQNSLIFKSLKVKMSIDGCAMEEIEVPQLKFSGLKIFRGCP